MLILNYSWAVWLAWLLGAFFIVIGIARLADVGPAKELLMPWRDRRCLASGACVAVGLMIAWYPSRPFGLLLGLVLCIATWALLLRRREPGRLPGSFVLAALILLAAWGLRLI